MADTGYTTARMCDSSLCHVIGAIASLSLAGHAVMEFRQGGHAFALLLPPRSLLVMAGLARYCWQHYIPHRKADWVNGCLLPRANQRVSFTFRKVLSAGTCLFCCGPQCSTPLLWEQLHSGPLNPNDCGQLAMVPFPGMLAMLNQESWHHSLTGQVCQYPAASASTIP